MLKKVARIFQRRDPRREASLALARITTLTDMNGLPWDSGVYEDRRTRDEVPAALGVWVRSFSGDETPETLAMDCLQHAVCCDLRASGLGVLTTTPIEGEQFMVAVPNGEVDEDSWKFFVATACHRTPRPGGLYLLGLRIERLFDLSSGQNIQFRTQRTEHLSACAETLLG